ncbi:otoancorin [Chanos chanos]|uniref:Otoancorin n=1 Tax=Chanos chanos TaxID=29144 RepID=A0A6J2W7A9_CHACN|nr:otoancorin [Chanos chanos]
MSAMSPDRNQSAEGFPPLPPNFHEMAKTLMIKCSKQGPVLRTNHNPNDTTGPPVDEADWNVMENMWNCSSLPQLIELMKNTTNSPRCFMRAFAAPLAWLVVSQKGANVDAEVLGKLLWAAKPLLETMPPAQIDLPPNLDNPRLDEMMKLFREVFSSFSEEQKSRIRDWVKERVAENEFRCTLKPQRLIIVPLPSDPKPSGLKPTDTRPPQLANMKPMAGDSDLKACSPRMPWLKAKVLRMMGRFVSQLPPQDIKTIPQKELCEFYEAPEFPTSFQAVGEVQPSLGRTLLTRLRRECSPDHQNFLQNMDRLGSLACFYDDDTSSLDVSQSKKFLSQLKECHTSATDKIKKQLVKKLLATGENSPTPELLQSLGPGVSVLPPSTLSKFSPEALKNTLSSLSQTTWNPAQAKTLAKALLNDSESITGVKLLSLGSVVRGVGSAILKKVKAEGLLGSEGLQSVSEKMSSLQKKALLKGLSDGVSVPELVKKAPDSLLSTLSLSTLDKADLSTVDEVGGRSWTRAQSAFLVKKILGEKVKPGQIRKLGKAVQGLTCAMIDSVSQNETMETAQALSESSDCLSKTQVRCAAKKLFASLERQRASYFANVTDSELQAIPVFLLIHLPVGQIARLPDAVCPRFLEMMSQANLSSLPYNAPQRPALTAKALTCLGKNMSNLSSVEVSFLGSLVCEMNASQVSSLSPDVLNMTLLTLASCPRIPPQHRPQLYTLVVDTFGDPSNWSEDDMTSLGPLLLLNGTTVKSLPYKPWLKSALSYLLDSMPEEPNLSILRWKMFTLTTGGAGEQPPAQRRRRREVNSLLEPTVSLIEELGEGNMYWSPAQLADMSVQTFTDTVPTLGAIHNYTAEQLSVLREKAIEAWGPVASLNESKIVELGCVSQGFTPEELQNLSISSVDTLEILSACRWNQTQREAMWRGFMKRTGMNVSKLGSPEIVGLGQFICGIRPNETEQLQTDAFRESVEVVGFVHCPLNMMEKLKDRAVAVFGDPSTWSEAQVSAMGNLIAGLNASELQRLNASVLPFISQSAIPLILPGRLAALSVSQLRAMGPDNAAMVTEAQRAGFTETQRSALAEAEGTSYSRNEEPTQSPQNALPQQGGAPRMSTLGIVVLLQPLLLMLLGFVG